MGVMGSLVSSQLSSMYEKVGSVCSVVVVPFLPRLSVSPDDVDVSLGLERR